MKLITLSAISMLTGSLLLSSHTFALTMSEFKTICESSTVECKDHPILQAYVGGALDVVAVLAEETSYLDNIYCEDTSTLFDIKRIIPFMEQHQEEHATNNAMLVLIKYLEEHSGC
ncbi:MAG: hypothetical protein ACRBHB_23105 [Arenicella sp.]